MLNFELLENRELLSAVSNMPLPYVTPETNFIGPSYAAGATPTGESFFVFDYWNKGNSWSDAEKSPIDGDDNLMCWAAAAANVLSWGGWGNGTYNTCDEIFNHLQDHSPDTTSIPDFAWRWWFEGGPSGSMDSQGGYFTAYEYEDWAQCGMLGTSAMAEIHYLLQAGYGVALTLGGPGGHVITCWGVNYDPVTKEYLGIWVTDSDDMKNSQTPEDQLKYYGISQSYGTWYLQNYYGSNSWYITRASGLMGNPDTLTPIPNAVIEGTIFNDLNGNGLVDTDEAGLVNQPVFLDANGNGNLDNRFETFSVNESISVVDKTYSISTLDVETAISVISDLNITLDISHTFNSDMSAWLIAPDGTQTLLFASIGGSGDGFDNVTFDDEISNSARDAVSGIVSGSLQPFYRLSTFDGLNPNGEWQLKVYDRRGGDKGAINFWSLEIAEIEKSTITDENGYFVFNVLPSGTYSIVTSVAKQYISQAPNVYDHVLAEHEIWSTQLAYRTADRNEDGRVTSYELDLVRAYWSQYNQEADLNGDKIVNSKDLDIVRSLYTFWLPWWSN